jgi:hypothetical protein
MSLSRRDTFPVLRRIYRFISKLESEDGIDHIQLLKTL